LISCQDTAIASAEIATAAMPDFAADAAIAG